MSLQVAVSGEGPNLVLLHGWGMPADVWRTTADALSTHFRVHCVDLPGYNNSQPAVPYTPMQVVAQLGAALPSALVCGWSLGGQLALQWALQAPQQVRGLILVATTPCFTRRADWQHGLDPTVVSHATQGVAADPATFLSQFAVLIAHGDTAENAVARQLRQTLAAMPSTPVEVLLAGLRWLAATDLRTQLPAVQPPVLVIHGNKDAIAPSAAAAALAAALPRARLHLQHGVAHAPFLSRPDEFVAQVMAFSNG